MTEPQARSRSGSAVPAQNMSRFARTSRELVKNIAVQCLSPTLPRDVPPELLERSRKVAADQRRIIATRAGNSSDSSRSANASSDEVAQETAGDAVVDGEENGDANDEADKMSQDGADNSNSTDHNIPVVPEKRAQMPVAASAPTSPRADPSHQPEPRSAPPYPTSTSTAIPPQFRQEYSSSSHANSRFQGPPFVQYRSARPPLHPRAYPSTPYTAPYTTRAGPQRRHRMPAYPPYHYPPPSAPAGRPESWRRLDYLESMVFDLMHQVSDLQTTNRKLLESQLQQSQLVNLYGLAQSGTLSPTQFSRYMATFASKVDAANIVTPTNSEFSGRSAPGSNGGPSSGSRSSSSDLQSDIFEIIHREQQAGDRARGTRLAPSEIPPESELMPSPRLHPPADWGRMSRSKAPPSEVRAYSPTDESVPLAGRRCGRLFSLNLDVLRQSSQSLHSADSVKQESEPASDTKMGGAEDSDDYDEPAESALTPEAEGPAEALAKQEATKVSQMPAQFMSMCTKMWHVLEA